MRGVSAILFMVALFDMPTYSQKRMTDAENDELKGKVQEIIHARANLELKDGKWNAIGRQVSSIATYGPQGNQLARKWYDYRGNPSQTTTYPEVDGFRAMKTESIHHGYNPPPPMARPSRQPSVKPDPRYSIRYIDKYDDRGYRTEVLLIKNDGEVLSLLVYKFNEKGHQTESEQWTPIAEQQRRHDMPDSAQKLDKLPRRIAELEGQQIEMVLNSKSVYRHDEQGNVIELFSLVSEVLIYHARYEQYEFDANKNWTKRTLVRVEMKDWKEVLTPEAIEYRGIKYYP